MARRTSPIILVFASLCLVFAGGCADDLESAETANLNGPKELPGEPSDVQKIWIDRGTGEAEGLDTPELPPGGASTYGPGSVIWAQRFGGTGADITADIALGSFGEIVVAGTFSGAVDFGGGPFEATDGRRAFAAMYDTRGRHLWSVCTSGTGDHHGHAVATDSVGNIYIAGEFTERLIVGDRAHDALGRTDAFVAKYNANGALVWSRVFGGEGEDIARAIAVDASGRVVVAGTFTDVASFDGFELTSRGGDDIYVVTLSPQGQAVVAFGLGTATNDMLGDVTLSHSGSYAVFGTYEDGIEGQREAFAALFSRHDTPVWLRSMTGPGDSEINAATFDGNDNLYMVGSYTGRMALWDAEFTWATRRDGFVVAMSAKGNTIWKGRIGTEGDDIATSVAVDPLRGIAIAGTLDLLANGGSDLFLITTRFNGSSRWGRLYGGSGRELATGLMIDYEGRIVITGGFEEGVSFDGDEKIESAGGFDVFLVRLAQ